MVLWQPIIETIQGSVKWSDKTGDFAIPAAVQPKEIFFSLIRNILNLTELKLSAEFLRKRYIQEKSFKSFKATSDVSELNCIGKKNIRRVKSL